MKSGRILSRGDVHLVIAGIFLGAYVLVRMTDPSDYQLSLDPRLDKVWSMWRMIDVAVWLALALAMATFRKGEARARSFSYGAAAATGVGLPTLVYVFSAPASWIAVMGSLAVYVATSGALCLKIKRPIPAALMGAGFFVLQILMDGIVHTIDGSFAIH